MLRFPIMGRSQLPRKNLEPESALGCPPPDYFAARVDQTAPGIPFHSGVNRPGTVEGLPHRPPELTPQHSWTFFVPETPPMFLRTRSPRVRPCSDVVRPRVHALEDRIVPNFTLDTT